MNSTHHYYIMKKIVAIALSVFFLVTGFIFAEGFIFSAGKVAKEEKNSPIQNIQNKDEISNSTKDVAIQEKPISFILSLSEVSKHNIESDCWITIRDKIYDVSSFLSQHPGGAKKIISQCGNEVSGLFASIHSNFAWDLLKKYYIGDLNSQISLQDQKILSQSQMDSVTSSVNDEASKSAKGFRYDDDEEEDDD